MTNAYLICGDHMRPAIDKFCLICRERDRKARIASSDHIGGANKLMAREEEEKKITCV
jgi:hypothetical protein